MKQVVNIGQYRASRPRPDAENPPSDAPEGSGARGRATRTRGILLHFPGPPQGPLCAAAVAALAVLGFLISAVRV